LKTFAADVNNGQTEEKNFNQAIAKARKDAQEHSSCQSCLKSGKAPAEKPKPKAGETTKKPEMNADARPAKPETRPDTKPDTKLQQNDNKPEKTVKSDYNNQQDNNLIPEKTESEILKPDDKPEEAKPDDSKTKTDESQTA
jgi:hypothetical protein